MKTASLVHFYFGEDSYVNRLAQETVPVHLALQGYDKAVVLRHETDLGPFELSEKAERKADIIDVPTRENLAKYLNQLGDEGYAVDLFIFSHGWKDRFRVTTGEYGENRTVTGAWLEANVRPLKLRMVWGCNCYGATLNDTWAKLGARVSAGSRYVNFYPTFFRRFVTAWNDGVPFSTAVAQSGSRITRSAVQAYLIADAVARLKEWEGKVWEAPQILGKTSAAERYFKECWVDDDWQEGKSGKQNMNYSSHMVIQSSSEAMKKLTKSDTPSW